MLFKYPHKFFGNSSFLVIVLVSILIFDCNRPEKKTEVDRSRLTIEQKRLPENAVSAFKVVAGLEAELFASEPMMLNPTNMDIDHRGRVWITEGYNYRYTLNPGHPVKPQGDRILILEDTNGDGKADTSKVFYQDSSINAALGIVVLGNKVIVSCSPNVFILTDSNGDDKADQKEVLFSGVGGTQHDHGIHAFTFGPDGKLYFNFGNAGDSILDRNGRIIKDNDGNVVNNKGKPYRQGMVFRCDMDGSNFEVLANNFRNNYEVAVDAFGNLWQSDNDDDGNRGVRINYVMEFGNYGYTDEMTGAGWSSRRMNMEDSIPYRHWHLNDPGVVPNLLQTGSGSPTGMLIYAGSLLPEKFYGQMIHAEPGHNVVRSYPVKKEGAGYSAEIVNILESRDDEWFRPSDVCIAPDGSLFIADWYDPGVGGHQVADLERGRVFRVAPDIHVYKIPEVKFDNIENNIKALESPNLATRYLAWQQLHAKGKDAEKDLASLFNGSGNPDFRARALWLLSKLAAEGPGYIQQALRDKNEDIVITAIKAAREIKMDMIPIVKQLGDGNSAQVRRELLTSLRHNNSPEAPGLWAKLAQQYDGKDRWYLEALGISADLQWDSYFDAWLKLVGDKWNSPEGRDIIWRARAKAAVPLLAKVIMDPSIDPATNLKFFRAFDFHQDTAKQAVLLSLLNGTHPKQKIITIYSLIQLDTSKLTMTPVLHQTIIASLQNVKGQQEYLDLLSKFRLKGDNNELLNIAVNNQKPDSRTEAMRLLILNNGKTLLKSAIKKDTAVAMQLVAALGRDDNKAMKDMLQEIMMDKSIDITARKNATEMLHNGWNGQEQLMKLVIEHRLPQELDSTAEKVLLTSWRQDIRQKAIDFYHKGASGQQLENITILASLKGNPENGKATFVNNCAVCHQVNGSGTNFGPDLSEIGAKLSKEGLYDAILHPDAGISFGYEGYLIKLKSGEQLLGYITSETPEEISIKTAGGTVTKMKKKDISSKKPYDHSLMPAGLVSGMKQQQVVDLVEWLSTQKKKK